MYVHTTGVREGLFSSNTVSLMAPVSVWNGNFRPEKVTLIKKSCSIPGLSEKGRNQSFFPKVPSPFLSPPTYPPTADTFSLMSFRNPSFLYKMKPQDSPHPVKVKVRPSQEVK